MIDGDRRPTAQEIEELIDLVRRDPASPAFIDLGEAYLALGRPRDAVQIGTMGLQNAPDSNEGRVMLARAYASQHQWKEAQGELLRVVKVDRTNRQGFALLGEVLLRRNDFERAVPVLQHAQNLDPTSPNILAMLKRARAGQGLDAPPPIPTPVPPRGETDNGGQLPRGGAQPPARRGATPPAPEVPRASPNQRTIGIEINPPAQDASALFPELTAPPPPAMSSRAPKQTAPPPIQSVEGIRPRIVSKDRPTNAAGAALRQSAAVGENYLNDLLTGGLLDVAGVRVPDQEFDLRPDRRWGRSTRRAFIFLFVVLVLGIGGGGTWYWWSGKQRAEAVAKLQSDAHIAIKDGTFDGFETSLKKLAESLEKDNANVLTFAYVVETAGLEALLYGTDSDRVDRAYKSAINDIKPGMKGYRELIIGKAAAELARLGQGAGDPVAIATESKNKLAEVTKSLDDLLAKDASDKWALWLKGRALLAAGERKTARSTLKVAQDGTEPLVVAEIDYADMLTDDGQLDDALKLYDKVTMTVKDHPLAVAGRSLARAEASVQVNDAIDELAVKLDKNIGPRVQAYRDLALSLANSGIEDYPKATEALHKAVGGHPPNEPRFWARVAWAHYASGNFADCVKARGRIAWYGKGKAEDDPTVELVDAGLLLAAGNPSDALDKATKIEGIRPRLLRVYALLDLQKAKEALAEADDLLKLAPENVEAQILREEARMVAGDAKERQAASDALDKLARNAKSKLGRHALGMALIATNDPKSLPAAQEQLTKAITDISDASPNPLAYRTHTALAELMLQANDIAGANKQLDDALAANSGYLPTRGLQAKVALKSNDPDKALELLATLPEKELSPSLQLAKIEAVFSSKKTSAADKDGAKEALKAMKDTYEPKVEISRVLAILDPKLVKEWELPEPPAADAPPAAPGEAPKPPEPKKHHHH
ncbi:MAG TPA: tetratricopeptide repeat protein [Kofleriaceae bacterium]|jgi:tetratricopeptide (TPR) repeat protein